MSCLLFTRWLLFYEMMTDWNSIFLWNYGCSYFVGVWSSDSWVISSSLSSRAIFFEGKDCGWVLGRALMFYGLIKFVRFVFGREEDGGDVLL